MYDSVFMSFGQQKSRNFADFSYTVKKFTVIFVHYLP